MKCHTMITRHLFSRHFFHCNIIIPLLILATISSPFSTNEHLSSHSLQQNYWINVEFRDHSPSSASHDYFQVQNENSMTNDATSRQPERSASREGLEITSSCENDEEWNFGFCLMTMSITPAVRWNELEDHVEVVIDSYYNFTVNPFKFHVTKNDTTIKQFHVPIAANKRNNVTLFIHWRNGTTEERHFTFNGSSLKPLFRVTSGEWLTYTVQSASKELRTLELSLWKNSSGTDVIVSFEYKNTENNHVMGRGNLTVDPFNGLIKANTNSMGWIQSMQRFTFLTGLATYDVLHDVPIPLHDWEYLATVLSIDYQDKFGPNWILFNAYDNPMARVLTSNGILSRLELSSLQEWYYLTNGSFLGYPLKKRAHSIRDATPEETSSSLTDVTTSNNSDLMNFRIDFFSIPMLFLGILVILIIRRQKGRQYHIKTRVESCQHARWKL